MDDFIELSPEEEEAYFQWMMYEQTLLEEEMQRVMEEEDGDQA